MDENINIVGSDSSYVFEDVKDLVIKLAGKWYFKTDDVNLIRVKTDNGLRIYRKKSPLVCEISPGRWELKSNCYLTDDGIYLVKNDPNTVIVDGKPVRKDFTVLINQNYYLRTDERVARCIVSRNWGLKENFTELSHRFYSKGRYVNTVDRPNSVVTTATGDIILKNDSRIKIVGKNAEPVHIHGSELDNSFRTVFLAFQDETNPDPNRIKQAYVDPTNFKYFRSSTVLSGIFIHESIFEETERKASEFFISQKNKKLDAVREKISRAYSDNGPDENQAVGFSLDYQTWGGKQPIHTPQRKNVISKPGATKLTGGIDYTFGVELETSAGLLNFTLIDELGVHAVGDRSIGSAEYVTGILHGDSGIQHLEKICSALAQSTLVDDRCGIHVHVGGLPGTPGVGNPALNRHFAVNAIKLGCQIEKDLYEISPTSRHPELYHCHSIMRYADINQDNWKDRLGPFLFGPKENWSNEGRDGYRFPLERYTYGNDGRTASASLGNWSGGKYKWLNLVPTVTRAPHKTCEFRLFAGSTNFTKIYSYVLISLAFVWFIENRLALIEKGGVTLESMITEAFGKNKIGKTLLEFCEQRKKKFNRVIKYPTFIKNIQSSTVKS